MEGLKDGYDFFAKVAPTDLLANLAGKDVSQYVGDIDLEIDALLDALSEFSGSNKTIDTLSGDLAEFWHAHTFNIDAVVKGSEHRAWVPRSSEFGSIDIETNFGESYQLKYYATGEATAKAQSVTYSQSAHHGSPNAMHAIESGLHNPNDPVYGKMKRLIPDGQEEDAVRFLREKIVKESSIRPDQVERYQNTLDNLETRVKDGEGVESRALSRDVSRDLAKDVKSDAFDVSKYGLSTEQLIEFQYIIDKALEAGTKAAALSFAIQLAPVVISAVDHLVKTGEIDAEKLREGGLSALSAGSRGFVTGTVSAGVIAYLEINHISVDPSVVSAATVLLVGIAISSWKVARGKMTGKEMANELMRSTYTMVFAMGGGKLGQALIPVPVLGYLAGSLVGSLVAGVTYQVGSEAFLGLCIESGATFFGLVEQDYEIPESVIKDMGLDAFDYETFEPNTFEADEFTVKTFSADEFEPVTIQMVFVRRGVLSANRIGYVT